MARVLVVDDAAFMRKMVSDALAKGGHEVVGEAGNGEEAVAEAVPLKPDVILMDLIMPQMDGIAAIERILAAWAEARILVLTSFDSDDKVFPAIRAGARGYTLKNSGSVELAHAIRQVYNGESSLHPAIALKVLKELAHPSEHVPAAPALTERELEVLRLVAQGESNQQIAVALCISEATVRKHVSNILTTLHLSSRIQAALYALREGLTSLEDTRTLS